MPFVWTAAFRTVLDPNSALSRTLAAIPDIHEHRGTQGSDMRQHTHVRRRRFFTMLSLILAGEAIFVPPFHLGRYFKSSMLSTFGIDEFQLGSLGAVYGILAMASYLLGGPLADRFSARKLMTVSLVATGCGSLYMATNPGLNGLYVLYGFLGVTTILLFWAPLIRSTRQWGGADQQGRAFGILDGGRGLAAALLSAVLVYAFSWMVGVGAVGEGAAVRTLLFTYFGCCLAAAACVWRFVPESASGEVSEEEESDSQRARGSTSQLSVRRRLSLVCRMPDVWLNAGVIIAAYSTFKMFDNYGLYSEDAYGFSRAGSAQLVAYLTFLRVAAALLAGWIADRFLGASASIELCFALLIGSYAAFLIVTPGPDLTWFVIANLALGAAAFFGLRGIYFALLSESGIPPELTGTAVGVICFVGFTPEIFMPPVTGWFIAEARSAGDVLSGYDRIFWFLIILSALGWLAAATMKRRAKKRQAAPPAR